MDYCCLRKRRKQLCNRCKTRVEKGFLHLLHLHIYKLYICVNISYIYVVCVHVYWGDGGVETLLLSWVAAGDEGEPVCSQGWHIPFASSLVSVKQCSHTHTHITEAECSWTLKKWETHCDFSIIQGYHNKAFCSCKCECENLNPSWCCVCYFRVKAKLRLLYSDV